MTDCKSFKDIKALVEKKSQRNALDFLDQCMHSLDSDVRLKLIETENGWAIRIFVAEAQMAMNYIILGEDTESMVVSNPFFNIYDNRDIRKAAGHLFDTYIPALRRWTQMRQEIDRRLGDLAVRLSEENLRKYTAGFLEYSFQETGLVNIRGIKEPVSVEDAIPKIAEALREVPEHVTRGKVNITTILYIYEPKSNTKCPRQDVIEHFQRVFSQKLYETGAVEQYRDEHSIFTRGDMWGGIHVCEGEHCGTPGSSSFDYHLLHNRKPTYFATNILAVHYLLKHWDDVYKNKSHLDRLNAYLKTVGIEPIA